MIVIKLLLIGILCVAGFILANAIVAATFPSIIPMPYLEKAAAFKL